MDNNFHAIPDEMKIYRQWLCWRYMDRGGDKPTKVPFNVMTGAMASVTEPSSWCSFEEAVAAAPSYDGIGFVLTKNDPYTFIDLDDTADNQANLSRQLRIFKEFDSYSERSPSGKGLHIIVKGHVPNGCRRASVELYSSERYMTMTGVVHKNKPIMERQQLCQTLWAEMGGAEAKLDSISDMPATATDHEIIEKATEAKNGRKFDSLYQGRWNDSYPSQSEADFALISILAFWTQNIAQIKRLFLSSKLGERDKAKRENYVMPMIQKALVNPSAHVEIMMDYEDLTDPKSTVEESSSKKKSDIFLGHKLELIVPPPGLLGDIAQFMFDAAPRPVAEIAISGAIAYFAGIVGRPYNISGTGLNQYILLLAATGTGKEAMSRGANKLMGALREIHIAVDSFIGPSDFASGPAIVRHVTKSDSPCFYSIVGEFGLKMQQLAHSKLSQSDLTFKRVFLDLYNKSGSDDWLASSAYADKEKNTSTVRSPAFTFLGESTFETFYSALDENLIADGLLPRFIIIEYAGARPNRNKLHGMVKPRASLIERLSEVVTYSLTLQNQRHYIDVGYTDEAEAYLDALDETIDDAILKYSNETLSHLLSRIHIKTLKLAALVAVGTNSIKPQITLEAAKWAFNVVAHGGHNILKRFEQGEIGKETDEIKQLNRVIRLTRDYLMKPHGQIPSYIPSKLHEEKIVPYTYYRRNFGSLAAFQKDRIGATNAIKRALKTLQEEGYIIESPTTYTSKALVYKVINVRFFLDFEG